MNHSLSVHGLWLASLVLGAAAQAQGLSPAPTLPGTAPARVVYDHAADGRVWALGTTYKAELGPDGLVYVPFLGSAAPRNFPVQFTLRSVRVGGRDLAFATEAVVQRSGDRVTLDRGAVRETYDLRPDNVEQTFVVDGSLDGDVDVELAVVTDLAEDAAQDGVQFGNELGRVHYGTAYLVRGATRTEIPMAWNGTVIGLHVPAAQRGAGDVVIDPIIHTSLLTATTVASDNPDIAYDATTDRFLATWVQVFSQTDHDVVAELRNGDGDPVAGSFKLIEASQESFTWPRVANLNSADRFLITMERFRPGDPVGRQYTVWGRTMAAPSPFATSGTFQISAPSTTNENNADVGGDSGTGTRWLVTWVSGHDIVGRLVNADGTVTSATIPIDTQTNLTIHPQVSPSNGNGLTATPRWCVTYQMLNGTTEWDVFAAVLDLAGSVTAAPRRIASAGDDLYPHVASPLTDLGGNPSFLITWERFAPAVELVARVVPHDLSTLGAEVSLTRRYGFTQTFSRVDCDGLRFAVVCKVGSALNVGTLAYVNNDLVLHEALQNIGSGNQPYIISKRSGGGVNTEYGIVSISTSTPTRGQFALYEGRASTGGFRRRSTSCGIGISSSGLPFLGTTAQFVLSNTGTDTTGFLLGLPVPGVILCANCLLGVDLAQPLAAFPAPLSLPLPTNPRLVGLTLAVQGFALGSGSCPIAALRLSDTIDLTIQ